MHFLHLLLPHAALALPAVGQRVQLQDLRAAPSRATGLPAPVVELAHQRHLLQLAYTDRLVGQVIDQLKAEGMWDKSLVVMGADHGEGWVPGEQAAQPRADATPPT